MVSKLVIFEKNEKILQKKNCLNEQITTGTQILLISLAPSSYSEFSLNIQTQWEEGTRDVNIIKVTLVIWWIRFKQVILTKGYVGQDGTGCLRTVFISMRPCGGHEKDLNQVQVGRGQLVLFRTRTEEVQCLWCPHKLRELIGIFDEFDFLKTLLWM